MNELKEKILKKFENHKDATSRYQHSLNVARKACEIIENHNLKIDLTTAEITGLVHDYAKFLTMDDFFKIVKVYDLEESILENDFEILHALLGTYIIKEELGIEDEEILEAIKYHTTGKVDMTPLQEVLFIADFIEDGRDDINVIRKTAYHNYKRAIAMILDFKINNILYNNRKLNEITLQAFAFYKKYLQSDDQKLERILETLDKNLVKDIKIYDVRNNTPLYDFVMVTTALSQKQMLAAAQYLKQEFDIRKIEFGDSWTLVDLTDVIVHFFTLDERVNYGLDKLLKDVPVREV